MRKCLAIVLGIVCGCAQPKSHAKDPDMQMGPDGTMYKAYVVTRKVAGRKWPESALRFIRSNDHGKTWSTPVNITDTREEFGSHNFHSMYVASNGIIYVSWLDGREGKAVAYMSHSIDGGRTWSPNVQLDAEEACPCCRTAVIADANGKLYVAWRKVFPGNVRDVVLATSSDTGKTWSKPIPVHNDNWVYNGCPHAGPSLVIEKDGKLKVTWWTGRPDEPGVYTALSGNGGQSFEEPVLLQKAKRPPGAMHGHS